MSPPALSPSASSAVSYLIDLGTGTMEELPLVPSAWAPDGKRLAAANENADGDETAEILVYDLDTGEQRVLAERSHLAEGLAWSPTGNLIAFTGDDPQSGTSQVLTVDSITGARRQVSRSVAGESATLRGWSPDGTNIVLERWRFVDATQSDLYQVSAEGDGQLPVTRAFPDGGSNTSASWVSGAMAAAPPSALPPVAVDPTALIRSRGVREISADGGRVAALMAHPSSHCGPVLVWTPEDAPVPADSRCLYSEVRDLTLAGRRLAWIHSFADRFEGTDCLLVSEVTRDGSDVRRNLWCNP